MSTVLTSPQGPMAITVKPREGTTTEFLSQVGYQQMNSVQNTMCPRQMQIKFILSYSFIFEGLIPKRCSFSNTEAGDKSGKDENLSWERYKTGRYRKNWCLRTCFFFHRFLKPSNILEYNAHKIIQNPFYEGWDKALNLWAKRGCLNRSTVSRACYMMIATCVW